VRRCRARRVRHYDDAGVRRVWWAMRRSVTRMDVFMYEQSVEGVHEKQVDEVDMSVGDQVAIAVPQNDCVLLSTTISDWLSTMHWLVTVHLSVHRVLYDIPQRVSTLFADIMKSGGFSRCYCDASRCNCNRRDASQYCGSTRFSVLSSQCIVVRSQ
jgi:hypothetical protein